MTFSVTTETIKVSGFKDAEDAEAYVLLHLADVAHNIVDEDQEPAPVEAPAEPPAAAVPAAEDPAPAPAEPVAEVPSAPVEAPAEPPAAVPATS